MAENETTNADPPECPTCGSELCPKCGCPMSGGPGAGCMTEHDIEEAVTHQQTIERLEYQIEALRIERTHLQARAGELEAACEESIVNCTQCDRGTVRWRDHNEFLSKPCPCCSAARSVRRSSSAGRGSEGTGGLI